MENIVRKTILLLTAVFLFSLCLSAQTKRALVIGLGEQQDKSWAKIHGDNDVSYVKAMLERAGYNEIDTLVNKQATKEGIVVAFQNMTNKCNNGDMVYIHFSGHGQQVTDVDGDEEDGWDEAWIPYDAYFRYNEQKYRGENHLIDDEINVLLTNIKGKIGGTGAMLVVIDACHSANATSGIDVDGEVRGARDRFVIPINGKGHAKKSPEQWLTLSACEQSYQQCKELKTPQVGCLTYALTVVSEKADVSYNALVGFVHKSVSTKQTPMLAGEDNVNYDLSIFFKP